MKVPDDEGEPNNTTNKTNGAPDISRTGKTTDRSTNQNKAETSELYNGASGTSRTGKNTDRSTSHDRTETEEGNIVAPDTNRTGKTTDRSTKHKKAVRAVVKQRAKQDEPSSKGKERLKRLRKLYQAELAKNLKFFQSARSFIELGSKPLSVKQSQPVTAIAQDGKADNMEQLD